MEDKNKYQEALNDIINNCKDFNVKNDSFWLIQNLIDENTGLEPKEVEELKRAFELACNKLYDKNCFVQDEISRKIVNLDEYFITQARKELEDK